MSPEWLVATLRRALGIVNIPSLQRKAELRACEGLGDVCGPVPIGPRVGSTSAHLVVGLGMGTFLCYFHVQVRLS